jgi:predicted nucleic acid-binding protein
MSSIPEVTLTEIEAADFNLVDQTSKLPAAAKCKRDQALEVLAKLRDVKGGLLVANPDILRKAAARRSTPASPHWFGLASVEPEVREMIKAARDRQSEVQRLAQASGRLVINVDRMPGEYAVLTLARRHRLTAYDAAYLELALGEALPLATLDEALASAGRVEGLSVIGANPAR